jgi:hypothetical protein
MRVCAVGVGVSAQQTPPTEAQSPAPRQQPEMSGQLLGSTPHIGLPPLVE